MEYKVHRTGKEQVKTNFEDVTKDILKVIKKGTPEDFVDLVFDYKNKAGVIIDINDPEIQDAIVARIKYDKKSPLVDQAQYLVNLSKWKEVGLDPEIVQELTHYNPIFGKLEI